MKTAEDILRQEKYKSLSNLVLICKAMEEYKNQFIDFDGPIAMIDHYSRLARNWEDAHARLEEKLRTQYDAEFEAFKTSLINRTVTRVDQLEEWLTEYRDQLLKHSEGNPIASKRNKYVINDINELLNDKFESGYWPGDNNQPKSV